MTGDEKYIIGVKDIVELKSLQESLNGLLRLQEMQEELRKELREDDIRWRQRMELKQDRLVNTIERINEELSGVPCLIDQKISRCREDREEITSPIVESYQQHHAISMFVCNNWKWIVAVSAFTAGILEILDKLNVI